MIKLEMTGKSASSIVVRLFGKNDFVDEATALRFSGGQPRHFNAAEPPLQHFEQRHEIPHGKDVVFHEQTQRFNAINVVVNAVLE